ncbi:glycosyltransferase [Pontibacter anaerobius]|uniref:Glycosyltransferase n=1 Tax=Pontibacter anaerobius TaxID=2993940 RepID=A0ABT3RGL8_9BACT|nr:glycosyltransferase [Pontibacter anaerobius]MCX2740981.1 glycosyltransferase [Pontibacter anaerobius]
MRIAFVIDGLQVGGAEKFMISVVNMLISKGCDPVIILLSDRKALIGELDERIPVYTVLRTSKYNLSVSKRIKDIIKEKEIRKVFCINTYAFFLTKLSFLFDRETKFYLSLHSTIPDSFKVYIQNIIYFRLISRNDHIIFICNNQMKYLQKKYYLSSAYKVVIYNGIDTAHYKPNSSLPKELSILDENYRLYPDDKVILNVARLYPEKGHLEAIKALAILHKDYNYKAHLLFVGGGDPDYAHHLKEQVAALSLESYVYFAGNQTDVRKFYCASDIFTLTSYSIETFSLAALEAMSYGLPCSLTEIGGANEMVVEGLTGALSKAKDPYSIAASWHKLLTSVLNKKKIRNYVVNKFSSQRMLKEYYQLICSS